jgi:Domain of Unknown Function (DUF928)
MRYSQLIMVMTVLGLMVGVASGNSLAEKKTKEDKFVARKGAEPSNPSLEKGQTPIQTAKSEQSPRMPVYKPPKRGAPGGRVGGGTRGDSDAHLTTHVLAPGQVRGLTSQEQPDLYWYVSKVTEVPIEFTLIDEDGIDPLVETRLPSPIQPGIQRIRLSDFGVRLSPEKMYRWSVALILDPEHRSKDIVASARIQRALPSEIPTTRLEQADAVEATFIHAEAGLWYDAIAAISQAIREAPEESHFQQIREALLEQVALEEVAGFNRLVQRGS